MNRMFLGLVLALEQAWHLGSVGVELFYRAYKLTYIDVLGLLKYIGDIVLFLLSCVNGKRSEKVKHDAVVKQLTRHSPWVFQRDALSVHIWVAFRLLADDLVPGAYLLSGESKFE
jgi:hypothetical protein